MNSNPHYRLNARFIWHNFSTWILNFVIIDFLPSAMKKARCFYEAILLALSNEGRILQIKQLTEQQLAHACTCKESTQVFLRWNPIRILFRYKKINAKINVCHNTPLCDVAKVLEPGRNGLCKWNNICRGKIGHYWCHPGSKYYCLTASRSKHL